MPFINLSTNTISKIGRPHDTIVGKLNTWYFDDYKQV